MTTIMNQSLILGSLGSAVLGWLMFFLSLFLILLILVQRGKGGGLTGALGGPGGQSAFGSKAGDTFTVITAVSAIIWGLVCAIAMYSLGVPPLTADDTDFSEDDTPALSAPADDSAAGTGTSPAGGLSGMFADEPGGESAEAGSETKPAGDAGTDPAESGTPSMELTPAESTDSTTTESTATETPSGEAPAAETPAAETPAAETSAPETAETAETKAE
ncbi:MAG: preprotein translocase subunit SecG [Planctomycetales bacterium]|nr:preprotein translocase subunit SecG [Planctomycetales bacterium]